MRSRTIYNISAWAAPPVVCGDCCVTNCNTVYCFLNEFVVKHNIYCAIV